MSGADRKRKGHKGNPLSESQREDSPITFPQWDVEDFWEEDGSEEDGSEPPATPWETAAFIADMLQGLSLMASQARLELLAYLLELAQEEAQARSEHPLASLQKKRG